MSKHRIMAVIIILFLAALFSVVPSYSQDDNPPIWDRRGSDPIVRTIDGKVISVDPQDSTITVKMVEALVISVPSSASVTNKDGFSIQLSQINPGNYVMVEYYDDKSGKHIARGINVEYGD
ncbi:MAG: hypothetical protein Q8R38_01005 [Candidatus Omnitrophota bacterium]|nr:hypothetical protein [Candidatus Omnitrophota bacterium]